jgi:hypothetical protein
MNEGEEEDEVMLRELRFRVGDGLLVRFLKRGKLFFLQARQRAVGEVATNKKARFRVIGQS